MSEFSEIQRNIVRAAINADFLDNCDKLDFIGDVVFSEDSLALAGVLEDWKLDEIGGILVDAYGV